MICRICIWIKQTSWTPCDCADPKSICFVSVSISKARSHDAERGIRSWRVTQLGLVMLVHLNYLQLSRTGFEVDWTGSGITVWGRFRLGLWRKCARCSPVQHPTSTSTPRGLEPLSQHPPHCRKPSHFTRNADMWPTKKQLQHVAVAGSVIHDDQKWTAWISRNYHLPTHTLRSDESQVR